jgi:hypothetical protein
MLSIKCWACVIFFACVCVGASDSTTAFDDPSSSDLCVVCVGCFLGGSQGGPGMAPLVMRNAPIFFFWRFLLFLPDFAIFSGFLNLSWIKGLGFWYLRNT